MVPKPSIPDRVAPPSRRITKPIILLGSGRSGTTLLGQILMRHPEVAYWGEPRPVWMYGHAYRRHHELGAEDLTPRIARTIDRRFARFLAASGRSRFAEKTPSNCLRIPFIHALYPDCKIVNIIRDGREVAGGMLRMQRVGADPARVMARVFETPLWEWPAYVPMFFRTVWRTKVLGKTSTHWGVKPAGWQEWLKLPPHLSAARQWMRLVETSIRHGRALPTENYLELRYERLIREPAESVAEIIEFAELPAREELIDYALSEIDPSRAAKTILNLSEQQRHEAEAEMSPLLRELGYLDASPSTHPADSS